MIIGNFCYAAQSDTYTGEIQTLRIRCPDVTFLPLTRLNEREPDYRILRDVAGRTFELGAAWRRRSEKGQDYLSVLLDDPTLPKPLGAALFRDDAGQSATMVWSRPTRPAVTEAQAKNSGRSRRSTASPAGPA